MERSKLSEDNKIQVRLRNFKFNRFEIPSREMMAAISHDDYWFPENLTVWHYLVAYAQLPQPVQKRYNQLYALATNELFGILENELIMPILKKLALDATGSPNYSAALNKFCTEEKKHADMFAQLSKMAEPQLYKNTPYFLSERANPFRLYLTQIIKRFPHFFGVWLWIVIYFEERSLLYARHFLNSKNLHVSPIFREIHRLHMLEETQHVQIDELLVETEYSKLNFFQKRLTAFMFKRMIQSFAAPRRMSGAIAKLLKKEFPESRAAINRCLNELPKLIGNDLFQNTFLGAEAAPRTWRLMKQQPEMAAVIKQFRGSI